MRLEFILPILFIQQSLCASGFADAIDEIMDKLPTIFLDDIPESHAQQQAPIDAASKGNDTVISGGDKHRPDNTNSTNAGDNDSLIVNNHGDGALNSSSIVPTPSTTFSIDIPVDVNPTTTTIILTTTTTTVEEQQPSETEPPVTADPDDMRVVNVTLLSTTATTVTTTTAIELTASTAEVSSSTITTTAVDSSSTVDQQDETPTASASNGNLREIVDVEQPPSDDSQQPPPAQQQPPPQQAQSPPAQQQQTTQGNVNPQPSNSPSATPTLPNNANTPDAPKDEPPADNNNNNDTGNEKSKQVGGLSDGAVAGISVAAVAAAIAVVVGVFVTKQRRSLNQNNNDDDYKYPTLPPIRPMPHTHDNSDVGDGAKENVVQNTWDEYYQMTNERTATNTPAKLPSPPAPSPMSYEPYRRTMLTESSAALPMTPTTVAAATALRTPIGKQQSHMDTATMLSFRPASSTLKEPQRSTAHYTITTLDNAAMGKLSPAATSPSLVDEIGVASQQSEDPKRTTMPTVIQGSRSLMMTSLESATNSPATPKEMDLGMAGSVINRGSMASYATSDYDQSTLAPSDSASIMVRKPRKLFKPLDYKSRRSITFSDVQVFEEEEEEEAQE